LLCRELFFYLPPSVTKSVTKTPIYRKNTEKYVFQYLCLLLKIPAFSPISSYCPIMIIGYHIKSDDRITDKIIKLELKKKSRIITPNTNSELNSCVFRVFPLIL